jgi:ComF family protein
MFKFITNWIFPTHCLCCGAEDEMLCVRCCKHIQLLTDDPPAPSGLNRIICATLYEPPISDAIQALKYGSARSLGHRLGTLIPELTKNRPWPNDPLVIPVPIHRRRERERGFNQAELLALSICGQTGWELRADLLVRTRYTPPQAKLDKRARQQNLADAFVLQGLEAIQNRHVILVDDVLTTGSTLAACAAALASGQPASISGLCLAYDELSRSII